MRKILLLLLISSFSWSMNAQLTDSTAVFKAQFLKNEYQRYEVSKTLYTLHRKDTTDLLRVGFMAEVVVSDSLENAYILKWKLSKFSISTDDANLQKLVSMAMPVVVSYRISKPGVFEEFITGTSVTSCLEAALPKVLNVFKDKSDSVSKVEVAKIFDLRENLETLMLSFMIQFHQFHGLGYDLGEVVSVPVEITSRFSTKPLSGVQRKKLTTIDLPNQTATIAYATNLNVAGMSEFGNMMLDVRTGWPIWSMNQREATANSVTNGEQLEIQYKLPN